MEILAYPPADPFLGDEWFPLDQSGKTRRGSIGQLGAMAASIPAPSGLFYSDQGALVVRFADRLFVGAAADNPGRANSTETPTDWLTSVMAGRTTGAWPVWGAQGASLARFGTVGFLTGSRTSDAKANSGTLGYVPESIGHASWVVNDDTANPTATIGHAYYGEAWRMPDVSYRPTFVLSAQAVNLGGPSVIWANPYAGNIGGGVYCFSLGSGGRQAGASDAAAVMQIENNPTKFQRGIVFGANSLTGTDGSSGNNGYATAIMLGRNQALEMWAPDGLACYYRSTVTAAANGSIIEHTNTGVAFRNASGQQVFGISNVAPGPAYASIYVLPGTFPSVAAGFYVEQAAGSPNLGLFPASGGELEITSPVTGVGASVPATVGGGWLHITVNGTDFRVPLYTSGQAGS